VFGSVELAQSGLARLGGVRCLAAKAFDLFAIALSARARIHQGLLTGSFDFSHLPTVSFVAMDFMEFFEF